MFPNPADLVLEIPVSGDAGEKIVRMAWPSDQQWIDRSKRRPIIQKNIGRGQTVIEDNPGHRAVDAELLNILRRNGDDFDEAEASLVLQHASYCEVVDVSVDNYAVTVELETISGTSKHVLRKPTAKQGQDYSAGAARVTDLPYGRQKITLNMQPAGSLYDEIIQDKTGYAGAVPVIHKQAVIGAVMQASKPDVRMVPSPN